MRDYPVRYAWAELSAQNEDLFDQLGPDHIEAFRSFFYSGVLWTMLNIMKRTERSRKTGPTDNDRAFFADVRREIDDFVDESTTTVGNA